MCLALGGMLFLMRKGYIKTIEKISPAKLKSPLEHIQLYEYFFLDILGVILAFFNILLIKNALKTLKYTYHSNKNNFLRHIIHLIHSALIYDMTFFYLQIFFKLFKWRINYHLK
jgi:hypothetical protein